MFSSQARQCEQQLGLVRLIGTDELKHFVGCVKERPKLIQVLSTVEKNLGDSVVRIVACPIVVCSRLEQG